MNQVLRAVCRVPGIVPRDCGTPPLWDALIPGLHSRCYSARRPTMSSGPKTPPSCSLTSLTSVWSGTSQVPRFGTWHTLNVPRTSVRFPTEPALDRAHASHREHVEPMGKSVGVFNSEQRGFRRVGTMRDVFDSCQNRRIPTQGARVLWPCALNLPWKGPHRHARHCAELAAACGTTRNAGAPSNSWPASSGCSAATADAA